MAEIEIKKDLKALNNEIAAKNRVDFANNKIYAINIIGSPGSGKTTLLENLIPLLSKSFRVAVIEGDLATENDAERVKKTGAKAVQINTNGACHLDARMIENVYGGFNPDETDILIIENVGNLVCPVSYDLGEDLRLVVLSTAEGEDKPQKYPPAMLNTNAVVITKTDLAKYVGVSVGGMIKNILDINPKADILETGITDGKYDASPVEKYITEKASVKIRV